MLLVHNLGHLLGQVNGSVWWRKVRLPRGLTVIRWDERDEEDRPAGSWIYWSQLTLGGLRQSRKRIK